MLSIVKKARRVTTRDTRKEYATTKERRNEAGRFTIHLLGSFVPPWYGNLS
jgi:hypothetical protein